MIDQMNKKLICVPLLVFTICACDVWRPAQDASGEPLLKLTTSDSVQVKIINTSTEHRSEADYTGKKELVSYTTRATLILEGEKYKKSLIVLSCKDTENPAQDCYSDILIVSDGVAQIIKYYNGYTVRELQLRSPKYEWSLVGIAVLEPGIISAQ